MMKKVTGIIEKASDGGFCIYSPDMEVVFGQGLSEEEAKEMFVEEIQGQAEYYKERKGEYPDWYSTDLEVEYKYDFTGFFKAFPFFNVTKFAEFIGINPSLMRKYKEGLAFASEKQKALIQEKLGEIVANMSLVRF